MKRRLFDLATVVALAGLAGCASPFGGAQHTPQTLVGAQSRIANPDASSKLKHIIIVIQENRSVDNLFSGFCLPKKIACADTVKTDPVSGKHLKLASLAAPFDPFHDRSQYIIEYDNGKMDGFPNAQVVCGSGSGSVQPDAASCPYTVFSFAPTTETKIYRQLATVDGILADKTFQTEQGPSFPSHLYAIAGQSGGFDTGHDAIDGGSGTCDHPKSDKTVDMTKAYPGGPGPSRTSCLSFRAIMDLLANKGHTWHYYSNSASSFWSATQSIDHLNDSPNFSFPSTKFISDVAAGTLADVTFVMPPSYEDSDHPGTIMNAQDGPNWVGSVVNAVGESPFWNSSAVIVYWDDWGGFFDHVKPPPGPVYSWGGNPNAFEYGFRVPMIVISPYVKLNTIDDTNHTFSATLRLIESTFKVGTLNTTDNPKYETSDLTGDFDFTQTPFPYVPVGGAAARPNAPHHVNANDATEELVTGD